MLSVDTFKGVSITHQWENLGLGGNHTHYFESQIDRQAAFVSIARLECKVDINWPSELQRNPLSVYYYFPLIHYSFWWMKQSVGVASGGRKLG